MITRRGLANELDRLDEEIAQLQKDKSEIFHAYRGQLDGQGLDTTAIKAEVAALKLAIRRRRELEKNPEAVAEKDALFEEILSEISGPAKTGTGVATRARAHTHEEQAA